VLARRVAADLVRFQVPGRVKNFKTELNALKGSGRAGALRRWLNKRLIRGIEVVKILCGDVTAPMKLSETLSQCHFKFLDEVSSERLLEAAPGLYEAYEEGDDAEEEGDDAEEEDDGRL
jgi:hypothetical protein